MRVQAPGRTVFFLRVPDQWDAGGSEVGFGGQDEVLQVSGGNCLW